jgi:hypothetical protein
VTESDTKKMLAYLSAMFEKQLPPETVAGWCEAMRSVPFERGMVAARKHVANSAFFPKVAEILGSAADDMVGIEEGEQAWLEVERAIRRWGRYREWKFDNPAIDLATEAIGKDDICNATAENIGTLRAQWIKSYTSFRNRELAAARHSLLAGVPFRSELRARQALPAASEPAPAPDGDRVGPETIGQSLMRVLPGYEPDGAA